jgi:glutaredoxin 3
MIQTVEMWTKKNCPYCTRAKSLLNTHNIPFTEKVLDVNFTKEQLVETYPSAKSYPVIVIDGFYIGGYTQLATKLNEEFSDSRQLLNE